MLRYRLFLALGSKSTLLLIKYIGSLKVVKALFKMYYKYNIYFSVIPRIDIAIVVSINVEVGNWCWDWGGWVY